MKNTSLLFSCLVLFFSSFTLIDNWHSIKPEDAANELVLLNKKILKNNCYSFKVNYTSYSEHNETKAFESQNGLVIKDGINLYSKLNGAITIQNKDLRIVIDSIKQFVKITNPLEGQEPNFNINDYIKILKICKVVMRKEVDKVIAFRFEPKATKGIVAQEIYFGEEFLSKSVIYYVNEHNIRENNEIIKQTVHPKLEIIISDFKKLEKVNKNVFKTDDVITFSKNGIELKERYKAFKFFDGRFKK